MPCGRVLGGCFVRVLAALWVRRAVAVPETWLMGKCTNGYAVDDSILCLRVGVSFCFIVHVVRIVLQHRCLRPRRGMG